MKLKLGLDIGIASVGWGIIDENNKIIDCGVRLFPENNAEGNTTRRSMRSARRRIRRVHHRLHRMKRILSEALSIELPLDNGNVYEIRCRGLKEKLSKEELFCSVMHLTKRRGTHFLTAEDLIKIEGETKSTEEILREQSEKLRDRFVCQVQYERFLQDGKVRGIENRFQNIEYKKELEALLIKQGEFYPSIKEAYDNIIRIYSSKREYYQGPGGPTSPTPYGCYRRDKDGEIIRVNLIELMRGKCTFFSEEKRVAKNSYTACLFNLLNDLNNMTVAGERLSSKQKKELVGKYIDEGKNVNLKNIAKVTGAKNEEIHGYRIDKNGKAIISDFTGYKEILKALEKVNVDSTFIKGKVELVDNIAEILTGEKNIERRYDELIKIGINKDIATELKRLSGFTQYHSLSKKAIELILDDLWESNKNQMQLFTEIGLFKQERSELKGVKIPFDGSDWIVSPVTKRAVSEAVKITNEARKTARKKYKCEFSEIVIEMAREKNSKEKIEVIKRIQKQNEETRKQIESLVDLKKINGKQFEQLKLLFEQDFRCAYSLKPLSIAHVLNGCLEIDHIIPRSLSFDDSLTNKVAVLVEENQKKGQCTPFQYLKSGRGNISYAEFKDWVLKNDKYKKTRKKIENLLYEGEPQKELKGFINRNLVDTRYASKEVLKLLKEYFKENQIETKVSVIKGSFTHAFRKKAQLKKDRDTTYAHHAQDALIVAGLSNTKLINKVNSLLVNNKEIFTEKDSLYEEDGKVINIATGELIEENDFNCGLYIKFIKNIDSIKPKYSHKVDRKPNRMLYDQQIKSTRDRDGKLYIITKYKDIYGKDAGKKLKKKIQDKPEDLLMYHNDYKTYEILKRVVESYPDSENPFSDYFSEHGPIKKYSKKGNGPFVFDVKYYDRTLGSYRQNNKQKGKNISVYLAIKSLRADFYIDEEIYKFINVPFDMLKEINNVYEIDTTEYNKTKENKKISSNAKFLFSLYTGEMFSYEKEGVFFEWFYNCVNNDGKNVIETRFIDKPSPGNTQKDRMITIGKKIKNLTKYNVDVLGNKYVITQEQFRGKIEV